MTGLCDAGAAVAAVAADGAGADAVAGAVAIAEEDAQRVRLSRWVGALLTRGSATCMSFTVWGALP